MQVPLLDLRAQYASIKGEVRAAVEHVLEGQQFILGPQVAELETAVAAYVGVASGVGVSSGSDALLVSLLALGVGPGDRVITTAYSFFATAGAVARLGAVPIFVDIDPVTYNVSPETLEKTWARLAPPERESVKALLPVHLFGQCADMAKILELAAEKGLPVVEDAAQAIGAASRDGRFAGSMGALGCLSFFPSKNLGGIGDGGMVLTNDPSVARRVRVLRNHGAEPKYFHKEVGGNFRLDTLQAAVLTVKLRHLDQWIQARRECADRYRRLFDQGGLTPEYLTPPEALDGGGRPRAHTYNQYVIRGARRDDLRRYLSVNGIATEIYYPLPLPLQECFRGLGHQAGDFPEAERAASETLALPMYPELTPDQQAYVVDRIRAFYRG